VCRDHLYARERLDDHHILLCSYKDYTYTLTFDFSPLTVYIKNMVFILLLCTRSACTPLYIIIIYFVRPYMPKSEREGYAINYIDFAVCRSFTAAAAVTAVPHTTLQTRGWEERASKMFSLCEDARRHSLTCPLPVNGRTRTRRQIYLVWTARAGRAHCMTIDRPEGSNPKWLLLFSGSLLYTHKWYNVYSVEYYTHVNSGVSFKKDSPFSAIKYVLFFLTTTERESFELSDNDLLYPSSLLFWSTDRYLFIFLFVFLRIPIHGID